MPPKLKFRTELGMSQKHVKQLGGGRKAFKWVSRVRNLAQNHLKDKSLETKVEIIVKPTTRVKGQRAYGLDVSSTTEGCNRNNTERSITL